MEGDDFVERTKVYRNALDDYLKLVLKVSPKKGGGARFEKTFAAILSASQDSLSARAVLNTAQLNPDGAKRFLAALQNRGTLVRQEKLPDVAIFQNSGPKLLHFLGETEASVQDLEEQIKKVNDLYNSSAR